MFKPVCDPCRSAAMEYTGIELSEDVEDVDVAAADIARDFGYQVGQHRCQGEECGCACREENRPGSPVIK